MIGNVLLKVMIVDDEKFVREGLRQIIDWESLGFFVCAEAGNTAEAFANLQRYHPQLILLDIRMPGMYGTDFIRIARENGYDGEFIILSGYSDFTYAQQALQYGAAYYLTKPIDEEKLSTAVTKLRDKIWNKAQKEHSQDIYQQKARTVIFHDLLTDGRIDPGLNYIELGFSAPIYQVLIYENYTPYYTSSFSFADILRVSNESRQSFDYIRVNNRDIVLLKGDYALNRFQDVLSHYASGTQKGSPLDMVFLAYGPIVSSLSQVHTSYEICLKLMERRFFCREGQHVLSYETLQAVTDSGDGTPQTCAALTAELAESYESRLLDAMKICSRVKTTGLLEDLCGKLCHSGANEQDIKSFLEGMFLHIKTSVVQSYRSLDLPFANNSMIIKTIADKQYLYEILQYFSEQFEMIMNGLGNNTGEGIIEEITHYIDQNYEQPLKLESIAILFGYNSSYLGKLFTATKGQNFNAYLDEVRIRASLKLLKETNMKIYEVAARVGYSNVDYYHQKFRRHVGMSPAEYRKANQS